MENQLPCTGVKMAARPLAGSTVKEQELADGGADPVTLPSSQAEPTACDRQLVLESTRRPIAYGQD
jgi:hypothetical protein